MIIRTPLEQAIITDSPDYFFLYQALNSKNIYDFNKIFTNDTGLAATTDGRRVHIIPHKGLLQPDTLYTPIPMSDTQMMLAPAGVSEKAVMWEIINMELDRKDRTPLLISQLLVGRFNPQYIAESIPDGVAWVLNDPKSYLLIEGFTGRRAIILPIVEIRHG